MPLKNERWHSEGYTYYKNFVFCRSKISAIFAHFNLLSTAVTKQMIEYSFLSKHHIFNNSENEIALKHE